MPKLKSRAVAGQVPADPEEFAEHLQRYDWFFYMSDDPRVYAAGENAEHALNAFLKSAACTPEHKHIYNQQHARCFNTPSFVSADRPYRVPFPEAEHVAAQD